TSVGRGHRLGWHRGGGLGVGGALLTGGTRWLAREASKGCGLVGACTRGHDGRPLVSRSAPAGASHRQPAKQPPEAQDRQLVEKKVWKHGTTPSLGGETGGLYLILGPMELSAA